MKLERNRVAIGLAVLVILLVTALAWWRGNRPLAQMLPVLAAGLSVALAPRWRAQPTRCDCHPTVTAKQD